MHLSFFLEREHKEEKEKEEEEEEEEEEEGEGEEEEDGEGEGEEEKGEEEDGEEGGGNDGLMGIGLCVTFIGDVLFVSSCAFRRSKLFLEAVVTVTRWYSKQPDFALFNIVSSRGLSFYFYYSFSLLRFFVYHSVLFFFLWRSVCFIYLFVVGEFLVA
jgi:hypothetical protein